MRGCVDFGSFVFSQVACQIGHIDGLIVVCEHLIFAGDDDVADAFKSISCKKGEIVFFLLVEPRGSSQARRLPHQHKGVPDNRQQLNRVADGTRCRTALEPQGDGLPSGHIPLLFPLAIV